MNITDFLTQSYGKLTLIDLMLIGIYLLACLYVGLRSADKIKDIKDYALGSGNISTPALIATVYATYLGAGVTLGNIERVSSIGALIVIALFLKPVSWWLSYTIFAKNVTQFRGCITLIDIMDRLYGNWGRIVSAYSSVFLNIATVAAQAAAIGHLLNYFLEVPLSVGVYVGMVTIIFYSILGGARAVVITDVFQFGVFYVVIPILAALLLHKFGGWESIHAMVPPDRWDTSLDTSERVWMFWGCVVFMILPEFGATGIQRYLMSMNIKQLKICLSIVALLDLTIVSTICLFGFILSTGIGGDITAQNVIWHMMNQQLFVVAKGVAVIGVLAIIMSTADSYLNLSGALIARNIVKAHFPKMSTRAELIVARIGTLGAGMIAIFLALWGSGVLGLVWLATNFGIVISVPLAAGFLGFRTNSASFVVSIISCVIGILLGNYIQGVIDVLSTILGIVLGIIGLYGTHYLQQRLGILHNVAWQEKIELAKWYEEEAQKRKVSVKSMMQERARIEKKELEENKKRELERKKLSARIEEVWHRLLGLRFRDIVIYSQRSVEKYEARYYEFAIFGLCLCAYPLLFLSSTHTSHVHIAQTLMWQFEICLHLLAGLGCVALGLHHMWSDIFNKKSLPLYFHFLVMCVLPALSTYGYLIHPDKDQMLGGVILAIFSLALFVDWMSFAIISVLGFVLGNITYVVFAQLVGYGPLYKGAVVGSLLYAIISIVIACLMRFIQEKYTNKLYNMANYDSLTGLANRHHLNVQMDRVMKDAQARRKELSVITLDIDHFKKLNDTYGHDVGDAVLEALGKAMQEGARPLDIYARLGGEEFLIVLPETNLVDAATIAERLRYNIAAEPLEIDIKPYNASFTVSLGVATLSPDDTLKSLIKRADKALYIAKGKKKQEGRNRVAIANGSTMEIVQIKV